MAFVGVLTVVVVVVAMGVRRVLFGGLVGTFIPDASGFPSAPGETNDLLFGVVTILLASATAGVGMYFIGKHLERFPLVSRLIMAGPRDDEDTPTFSVMEPAAPLALSAGHTGRAQTALRPSGRAEFDGQPIDVGADMGYIDQGETVRVVSVSEFRVVVERDTSDGETA